MKIVNIFLIASLCFGVIACNGDNTKQADKEAVQKFNK